MNLSACPTLLRTIEGGTWHRAVQPQHLSGALDLGYTRDVPSRFNAGGNDGQMQILYLGENQLVTLFEVEALFGNPLTPTPNPARPWTTVPIIVRLHEVADLSRVATQGLLDTTAQELTGDWKGYAIRTPMHSVSEPAGLAPTQELGAAVYAVPGLEGFITVSAKLPDSRNLVVFPQKLHSGSRLEYYDPQTRQTHVLP